MEEELTIDNLLKSLDIQLENLSNNIKQDNLDEIENKLDKILNLLQKQIKF